MSKSTPAKAIILAIGDKDFTFRPTVVDHNNYTNDLMPNNKIAPAHTFLTRTVELEQKAELTELLETVPGLTMELFIAISEASRGGLKVTLKN